MISDHTLRRFLPQPIVASCGDVIRACAAVCVLCWTVWWLTYAGIAARREITGANYSDFGRLYFSTRQFTHGASMYAPVPASYRAPALADRQQLDLNPPHLHVVLLPLAWLSEGRALAVWSAASVAVLLWSAFAVASELGLSPGPVGLIWAAIAVACSVPALSWLITGQVSLLLLGPLTAAWRAARRGRWAPAGAWMGLCWSVKPFLALFGLYFLVARRWRAAAWGTAVSLAAFALGIATFGWHAQVDWIASLNRIVVSSSNPVMWFGDSRNASLLALLSRTLGGAGAFAPASVEPRAIRPLWMLFSLAIAFATWRGVRRSQSVDRDWLLVMLAALLISPLAWTYYGWWLFGPAVAAWRTARPARPSLRAVALVAALAGGWLPWPMVEAGQPSSWATVLWGSTYTWSLIVVWGAFVAGSTSSRGPAASSELA